MADDTEKLLKSDACDSDGIRSPGNSNRKIYETKYLLREICLSLKKETNFYSPRETIDKVEEYIGSSMRVDRILYSEISSFIVGLNETERGVFLTNIENLLHYIMDNDHSNNNREITKDLRSICIKIYDHFQLNLVQIESANKIAEKAIADATKQVVEESHKEIKGMQKEYITILGIFAAIVLAFVGAFTFSTSVLNNIGGVPTLELFAIAIAIGLVFVLLVALLIDFLREINDSIKINKKGKKQNSWLMLGAIAILAFLALIALCCLGCNK